MAAIKTNDGLLMQLLSGEGRGGRLHRVLGIAGLLVLGLCIPWAYAAEEPANMEHRVKAAFLFKFPGYVDWPASSFAGPDSPITIAVAGAEAIAAELTGLAIGRKIGERAVVIRKLKPGESLAGTHVLFIGNNESTRANQLVSGAQPRAILTVTESEDALALGSVINFVNSENRIRFEIYLHSAEQSRLRLSSRLLAVAQQVHKGNR